MGQNKYTERWVRIKTQKDRSEIRYKEADQNYDTERQMRNKDTERQVRNKTQRDRSEIRHREAGQN